MSRAADETVQLTWVVGSQGLCECEENKFDGDVHSRGLGREGMKGTGHSRLPTPLINPRMFRLAGAGPDIHLPGFVGQALAAVLQYEGSHFSITRSNRGDPIFPHHKPVSVRSRNVFVASARVQVANKVLEHTKIRDGVRVRMGPDDNQVVHATGKTRDANPLYDVDSSPWDRIKSQGIERINYAAYLGSFPLTWSCWRSISKLEIHFPELSSLAAPVVRHRILRNVTQQYARNSKFGGGRPAEVIDRPLQLSLHQKSESPHALTLSISAVKKIDGAFWAPMEDPASRHHGLRESNVDCTDSKGLKFVPLRPF
ncbi:hypothetical protein BDM02DRAFT_3127665 [Thelephora ganbajun]|uniref:Uncharacterized protein n=1 Tax=Thelephora ganbajun TaxID=370292 RepID=A0ACB6ZL17_THEGA|nr:hypothetical protein BDM02DRAFT_3127665 [Thelephora ganbajun]